MSRMKLASGGALLQGDANGSRSRLVSSVNNASLSDINNTPAQKRVLVSPNVGFAARRELARGAAKSLYLQEPTRNAVHGAALMISATRSADYLEIATQTGRVECHRMAPAVTSGSGFRAVARICSTASSWSRFLGAVCSRLSRFTTRTVSEMTTALKTSNCGPSGSHQDSEHTSNNTARPAPVFVDSGER